MLRSRLWWAFSLNTCPLFLPASYAFLKIVNWITGCGACRGVHTLVSRVFISLCVPFCSTNLFRVLDEDDQEEVSEWNGKNVLAKLKQEYQQDRQLRRKGNQALDRMFSFARVTFYNRFEVFPKFLDKFFHESSAWWLT